MSTEICRVCKKEFYVEPLPPSPGPISGWTEYYCPDCWNNRIRGPSWQREVQPATLSENNDYEDFIIRVNKGCDDCKLRQFECGCGGLYGNICGITGDPINVMGCGRSDNRIEHYGLRILPNCPFVQNQKIVLARNEINDEL